MTHKAYLQDSYEDALRKNLELQAQLASMTEERNRYELEFDVLGDRLRRVAATLDIPTVTADGVGVDYLTLEKAIIETLEDMASTSAAQDE